MQTAVLIKPAGMEQVGRLENINGMLTRTCRRNGLRIVWVSDVMFTRDDAIKFYSVHDGKWFQLPMAKQIEKRRLRAYVIEGKFAPRIIRRLIGDTNPAVAKVKSPGSIRGQFADGDMVEFANREPKQVVDNCIHGSRNSREAKHEIAVIKRASTGKWQ